MNRILIRVDISDKIGGGHLMRMIGLGQLLADHSCEVHIASAFYKPNFIEPLLDKSFHLHLLGEGGEFRAESDLTELISMAKELRTDWIILDGYHFPVEYERVIRSTGFRCIRVDDLPVQRCEADVFLNHNYGSESFKHDLAPHTIKLTGLKYLMIRREFRNLEVSTKGSVKQGNIRLLISLSGGSDITDALNLKIVKALSGIKGIFRTAKIIVGKMGNISPDLIAASKESDFAIEISQYEENMAEVMLNSDIAITGGGYSMWELLYTKTPFVAVALNEVQDDYIRFLANEEICIHLGLYHNITIEHIQNTLLHFVQSESVRQNILERTERLLDRANNGTAILEIIAN